jgi:hypothetical protein
VLRTRRDQSDRTESILIEDTPQVFAEANGFRLLPDDNVGVNPVVTFRVEAVEDTTEKGYLTRLLWDDLGGYEQRKALLSKPATVIAIVHHGEVPGADLGGAPRRPAAPRRAPPRRRAPAAGSETE